MHTDFDGSEFTLDFGRVMVMLPDGGLIAAGRSDINPPPDARQGPGQEEFALARYTSRGVLDERFGRNGRLTFDLGRQREGISAIARQPDGKLLVAGVATGGYSIPAEFLALARVTADGRLDPSFGNGGRVVTQTGESSFRAALAVHIQADGKILVVGPTLSPAYVTGLAFVRYLPDGTPDVTFGQDGVRVAPFDAGQGEAYRALVDAQERVVVAGPGPLSDAGQDAIVARYTLDGERDRSFGMAGETTLVFDHTNFPGALAFQRDGRIIVAVSGQPDPRTSPYAYRVRLVRLTTDGVLDASFHAEALTDLLPPHSLAIDPADRIVLAGSLFQLFRHNPDGALDPTFAPVRVPLPFSPYRGSPWSIAFQPDGRLVGVGEMIAAVGPDAAPPDFDFAVARFHGGDDAEPPRIALAGVPRRRCVARRLRLRVLISDAAPLYTVHIRIEGRRLRARAGGLFQTTRKRFAVQIPVRRLRPGSHKLAVIARDTSDNRAIRTARFRRCR